jgi:CheY-like chemotaxis protein
MSSIAIENMRNAEAREANRIKDEFLATLSHELRTPLSAILGWTRTLRAAPLEAERAAHGLLVIERNVLAQTKLIDDLLEVSRIVAGKLRLAARPMGLAAVIEAAIEGMRPGSEARQIPIRFENGLTPGSDRMIGDPDRLQQVVWNLLSNAIKFTPPGGRVEVSLARSDGGFEVCVTDTGVGIRPEFLGRVFDRFRQADSSTTRTQGGLGIGLAISRHLVELHGGSISAASDGDNRGSAFTVLLPERGVAVSDEVPITADMPRVSGRRAELTGLRVLVVEDEPDGRELLEETFRSCGAQVSAATSVADALDRFAGFQPDVLVSDIGLPEEDGFSLMRKIRRLPAEAGGQIPAIAVTAYAREGDRQLAYDAGFQAHVAKPFEPLELAALVERLAGARPGSAGNLVSPESSPVAATGLRVLVVEDDRDTREGLRQLLAIWGHAVETAESAAEAIEKARERAFDAAVVDVGLPDRDGYEVARRLRETRGGDLLFLVALTGYVDPSDRQRAKEAGFDAHMGKPLDHATLGVLLASRRPPPRGDGAAGAEPLPPEPRLPDA